MLKSVHCEESLREYLDGVAPDSGFVTGLILGQRCQQRDYVVHMPPTPNFESVEGTEESSTQAVQTLSELNAYNLQSHAKNLSGLLSGGLNVLGIFSVCKDNKTGVLDSNESKKLQTLVGKLSSDLSEVLVFHYNCSTKKALCKYMDSKMHLTNVDFKFQANPIRWEEVDARFAFDFKIPLPSSVGVSSAKKNLKILVEEQKAQLENALCLIDGTVQDGTASMETLAAGDEDSKYVAEFLIRTSPDDAADLTKKKCSGMLSVAGHVHSRIFVHPKTSIAETVQFLKEDIARSLKTRVDLHTDALIEEEEGSPEEKSVQHDLPRRILIRLPYSSVKISNYLYPGENWSDSQESLELLLGCKLEDETEELEEEVEYPELMLTPEEREVTPAGVDTVKPNNLPLYVTLAGLVVIIAVCVGLLLNK